MNCNRIGFVGTRSPFSFCRSDKECRMIESHITSLIWEEFSLATRYEMDCHVGDCIGVDRIVFEKVNYLKKIGFKIRLVWHCIRPQIDLSFYKEGGFDEKVEYEHDNVVVRLRERTKGLVGQCSKVVIVGLKHDLGKGCSLGLKTARDLKIDHDVHFLVKLGGVDLFGEVKEEYIKRKYVRGE